MYVIIHIFGFLLVLGQAVMLKLKYECPIVQVEKVVFPILQGKAGIPTRIDDCQLNFSFFTNFKNIYV